jgi:hypothetical protein
MQRYIFPTLLVFALTGAHAQERISAYLFLQPSAKAPRVQTAAYWVNKPALAAVAAMPAQQIEISDFPIGLGETGTIELERRRSVTDGQTQWWIALRAPRDGQPAELQPFAGPTQYSFAGQITREAGSRVWISIVDGQLYAIVHRQDGTIYSIEPTGTTASNQEEHLLTTATNAEGLWHWVCSAAELPDYAESLGRLQHNGPEILQYSPLLQANVAVETTTSLYQRLGRSTARVASYIAAVFSMASRIYEDEVNITLAITWVMIWTEPPNGEEDPYQNDSDIAALLNEASQYWNRNWASVPRDLVHVMTSPSSTDVGGIARLATLCNRGSAYSVSGIRGTYTYPTLNYTWDVMVVAHEIGHVFGAPHTHDCYWAPPLDTCVTQDGNPPIGDACYRSPITPRRSWNGGSVMSYCHLVQQSVELTFRPKVANVIRNSRAANCLRQPSRALILMQNPVGNQQFIGGSMLEIRWTSTQVQSVAIEYSTDSLRSWTRIASGISASNQRYQWTLPNQILPTVWLRVLSESNPTVADTTAASFAVLIPAVQITSPEGGERYGFGEALTIRWIGTLVTTVRVLVSLDGGNRWDTLVASTSAQQYQWTIPNRPTTNAIVRIASTDDPAIYGQSPPFAIGQPVLQLLAPNGGEQWPVGSQQTIRWQSDFVNRIRIDYSTNAGANWRSIQFTYDATQQQLNWQVPNTPTDSALVRLRYSADPSLSVQSASVFKITEASNIQSVPDYRGISMQLLSAVVEGELVWLRITSDRPIAQIVCTLVTPLGQQRTVSAEQWVPAGETVLPVRLPSGISNGAYILRVETASDRWALPFLRLVQ